MDIAHALETAIAAVRVQIGDPTASVAVLVPAAANGVLAQRALARRQNLVRIRFLTPESLVREWAWPAVHAGGLRLEPPGWLRSTLRTWLSSQPSALGPFAATLSSQGWADPLVRCIQRLDECGLAAADLGQGTDQARVLERVMGFVETERAANAFATVWQLGQAATPDTRVQGAVLLGRRRLAPWVDHALQPWLNGVPHALVDLGMPTAGLTTSGPTVPVGAAPTVDLVSTPDPVRQCREAVRAIQTAIRMGTPLDRMAVALPNADLADVLAAHLEDAHIPARFMVGRPLVREPGAQLLRLALTAAHQPTLETWYALLNFPRLRLARNAGAAAAVGRMRWRRLLSQCNGTGNTVVTALAGLALSRPEDIAARDALVLALDALKTAIAPMAAAGPLAQHRDRWTAFLTDWLGRRAQPIVDALAGLEGPHLAAGEAREELDAVLTQRTPVQGLHQRGLLVAEPMGLLGGGFEQVFLLSASEGTLPRKAQEDPLLPDALVQALGRGLETTADRRARERRRFRAVVTAAAKVWVSIPRVEMLEGRPLLPSTLLLEHLGCTYSQLRKQWKVQGSRAQATTASPQDAIDSTEALLATAPTQRVQALVAHPPARRLMAYHLGVQRVAMGGPRCAWTGQLAAAVLPAPSPIDPGSLGWQLTDLGAALLGHLGARRPRALSDGYDPTAGSAQRSLRLQVVRHMLANPGSTLDQAVDAVLNDRCQHKEVLPARRVLARDLLRLAIKPPAAGPLVSGNAPLAGIQVAGQLGWMDGSTLVREVGTVHREPQLSTVIQAIVANAPTAREVDPLGNARDHDVATHRPAVLRALALLTAGTHPFAESNWGPALPEDPQG